MITIKTYLGKKHVFYSLDQVTMLDYYNEIIELDCSKSNLDYLPELPLQLNTLNCSNNNLTYLPDLPPYLECLSCHSNKLCLIPKLPDNLGWLYASNNCLTTLPTLPQSLQILYCSKNKLNSLPLIPNKVKYLYCFDNNLNSIPTIPENIMFIYFDKNPVKTFIDTYFEGRKSLYFEWKSNYENIYINKLEDWFLECKYNPKYKYCRDKVNRDYDTYVLE